MSAKKYCSAVCAIAKDENDYIFEWVAYHLALGFEHIFIYDNMSKNPVSELSRSLRASGRVTIIRWPREGQGDAQHTAYAHFLHTYRNDVEWAAVIDLDEFIVLKQHETINDFLVGFSHASTIAINWRIYGSAGRKQADDELLITRFQQASEIDFLPNHLIKMIYRLSYTTVIYVHCGKFDGGSGVYTPDGSKIDMSHYVHQTQSNFAIAQINHYFVKSYEEWERKIARGYTDGTARDPKMFYDYDRNEIYDPSALRLEAQTRHLRNKLLSKRLLLSLSIPERVLEFYLATHRYIRSR